MNTILNAYRGIIKLKDLWNWVASQGNCPLFVLDENGVNMENASVLHLCGVKWLYVDDQDGYSVKDEDELDGLWMVDEEDDHLEWEYRNGRVVDGRGNEVVRKDVL